MKRMSRHMTTEWLVDVCGEGEPFPAQISEVLAISLENEVSHSQFYNTMNTMILLTFYRMIQRVSW